MSLSKKYNIPAETVNKMIKDGLISCSWPRYEDIYKQFKTLIGSGMSVTDAYYEIAEKENISERSVRSMVYRWKDLMSH